MMAAARSLLLSLRRSSSAAAVGTVRYISSSDALRSTETLEELSTPTELSPDDLNSRIFRLRLPKRSATVVIDKWVRDGNQLNISQLRRISSELRKLRRYKHALEISEWMVTHDEFKLEDSDYADRIDLMAKVFGIDAAERYFECLPPYAKSNETYTALLHSYAAAKLTDKVEELYRRIMESGLSFEAITFNEMMTLYMSLGQVEKVSLIFEDMKNQNVAPDLYSYNLWISSCAMDLNVGRIQSILDEMILDPSCDQNWRRYINLVDIYITSGQLENLGPDSLPESELGITRREWISYDFLIMLHAGFQNKDKVDLIWKTLKTTRQKMAGRNYICILSSYLMLDHMKEVREVVNQWKQCTATVLDKSSCDRLVDAFTKAGFSEKCEAFIRVLNQGDSAS